MILGLEVPEYGKERIIRLANEFGSDSEKTEK